MRTLSASPHSGPRTVLLLFVVVAACAHAFSITNPTATVSFLGISSNLNTGSTFNLPTGVAVDALGDIFVVDRGTQAIVKIVAVNGSIPASPTIETLAPVVAGGSTAFVPNAPKNMAFDPSGNLFVACSNGLWELTAASAYATATEISATSFQGVAADSSGNLFVTNGGAGTVVKLASPNYAASTIISGLNTPLAIAVDASGDLFVADQSGASIKEYANSSGSYPSGSVVATAGSAHGLAIDAAGNLIISDYNNGVFELPAFTNYSSKVTLSSGFTNAMGAAVAPDGNIVLPHWTAGSLGAGVYQFVMHPHFGSSNLGTHTATSLTLPFNVANGITISSINVLTLGVANLDFKKDASSTCANTSTNTNCNVVVNFLPTAAGLRQGAVVINSVDGSSNTYMQTVPIYGMADAAEATIMPGTVTTSIAASGIDYPYQIAVDGSGNTYHTSYDSHIYEILAGASSATALSLSPASLVSATGLAIDGAGNLYIADSVLDNIYVATPTGGSWVLNQLPITGASVVPQCALAIDGAGNLYVADDVNNGIEKIAIQNPGTSLVSGVATVVPAAGYSFGHVAGVAVDGDGNVYAADYGNSNVVKITPAGQATPLTFPPSLGVADSYGVSVDGFGNVYVTDWTEVIEQTRAGVTQVIPGPSIGFAYNSTVDSAGNIYIADYDNGVIDVIAATAPQSTRFALTDAGQTSSDSPQTFSLTNLGDLDLTFSAIAYPASFPANSSDSSLCSPHAPLASGAECDVSINFIPVTGGNNSGSVTLTDNSLGAGGAVQSISVTGSGTAVSTVTTFHVSPSPAVAGQPVTFTASVSPAPLGGATVRFYNHGSTLIGSASVDSSGDATFTTSSLTAGNMSVTAAFAGNGGFNSSTSSAQSLVVQPGAPAGTPTTVSFSASPNPVYCGDPLTLTATVTPAPTGSSAGTVKFYSGSTLLGTATVNASGVATLTITPLVGGDQSITAKYSGNSAFASSTSAVHSQTVNPAYTVAAAKPQYSYTPGGSLQVGVNVPPLGGEFNLPITMSASGLPAGTTASFDPATVTPGAKGSATVLTIAPATASAGLWPNPRGAGRSGLAFALTLGGAFLPLGLIAGRRRSWLRSISIAVLLLATFASSGCGSGSQLNAVQPGTYSVTITGSRGTLHRSSTIKLVVE